MLNTCPIELNAVLFELTKYDNTFRTEIFCLNPDSHQGPYLGTKTAHNLMIFPGHAAGVRAETAGIGEGGKVSRNLPHRRILSKKDGHIVIALKIPVRSSRAR